MRHPAPMAVQRSITACAPMEVSAPMVTSSPMIAKGPILTPSASLAVGCTTARGSMETINACAPLEEYLPKILAAQLPQPGLGPQTPARVPARRDHAGV